MSLYNIEISPIEVRQRLERDYGTQDIVDMVSALKWAEEEILKQGQFITSVRRMTFGSNCQDKNFTDTQIQKLKEMFNDYKNEADKEASEQSTEG